MGYRYTTEDRILGGSREERLNPKFETSNRPGIGDLGARRLPNPMVKNTELQTIPEQDARRRARIGLPSHLVRR
jgi:hypothetical protein